MTYLDPVFGLLLVAAILLLSAARRHPRWIVQSRLSATLLLLWCWPPAAALLCLTLEAGLEPVTAIPPGVEVIVVLAGGAWQPEPPQPLVQVGSSTAVRCAYASWLAGQAPSLPVLASGGPVHGVPMARLMSDLLAGGGVPRDRIWLEDRSTSTYENAKYSAQLLRGRGVRRVLLVTEAYHMRRALRCFRNQGIDAIAAPCSFRARGFRLEIEQLIPDWRAIESNEEVLHEWAGLAWYFLRGR